ncbi:MAG: hypothetical protein V3S37_03305 [Dehalococcoidia bacterium]
MLWIKQCPRCQGDLYHNRDMYGDFVSCLQCGNYLPDAQVAELLNPPESRRLEEADSLAEPALVA